MTLAAFNFITGLTIELSLLLILLLSLRWQLKKQFKLYNSYWLWLALPLAPLMTQLGAIIWPADLVATLFNGLSFFNSIDLTPQSGGPHGILTQPASPPLRAAGDTQLSVTPAEAVCLLWLVGLIVTLSRLIWQHWTLRNELKQAVYQQPITLTAHYPVSGVNKDDFSPAVYGFFKPRIYFPLSLIDTLDEQQCSLILQHEEQHIRQGHLWLNLCWDIFVCLCWFNPLVYFSRQAFRHDQELMCDSIVLKNYDQPQRHAYGHALISTASATHSVSLLCSWKMYDQLEERIMNMTTHHPRFKHLLLSSAVCITMAASSLYALATAGPADEPSQSIEKPDKTRLKTISIINIDHDGDKKVSIKTDGKTYKITDEGRFVIEDGKQRSLTPEESKKLDDLLAKNERYKHAAGNDKRKIFDQERVYSFSFDVDDVDGIEKLKERFGNELSIIDIEELATLDHAKVIELHKLESLPMVGALDPIASVEKDIERALKDAQGSQSAAVKKARKQLEKVQKELAKSREKMQKQHEEAIKKLAELEGLNDQG